MPLLKTSNHDLTGNRFQRVFRLNLLDRIVPLGIVRGGTGLKPALVLLFLHRCGGPLFSLLIRYERHVHRLYQLLRRRR
jgi:hypothetical protein